MIKLEHTKIKPKQLDIFPSRSEGGAQQELKFYSFSEATAKPTDLVVNESELTVTDSLTLLIILT